jgi:hypothetical protein
MQYLNAQLLLTPPKAKTQSHKKGIENNAQNQNP